MCPPNSKYYVNNLSAERLKRCYDIAPPRVRQYLEAEVDYVLSRIHANDKVLELGCGYGRILPRLAQKAGLVVGIDISLASLLLARKMLAAVSNCLVLGMDATRLAFHDKLFDAVVCIQNGISAFHVNPLDLIGESIRVTRPGGLILFSSYSEKFWQARLEWFELQAQAGLLGEIDYEKTGGGVIVCKDGFAATTISAEQFQALTQGFNADTKIVEVDESSLFCIIKGTQYLFFCGHI